MAKLPQKWRDLLLRRTVKLDMQPSNFKVYWRGNKAKNNVVKHIIRTETRPKEAKRRGMKKIKRYD